MPLRGAGQFQPHRRQTGDGLVALGVHAGPDLLHQLPRVIVEFGGRGERVAILRGAGVRQFLPQGNAVGLAINGLVDRRLLRLRLGIGRRSGGE